MSKKRVLLLGVLLTCSMCAVLAVLAIMPRPGVTRENYERLQDGMSRAEVNAILGDTTDRNLHCVQWNGDSAVVTVAFDEDGCVEQKFWMTFYVVDERTLWQKFLDRLLRREAARDVMITR